MSRSARPRPVRTTDVNPQRWRSTPATHEQRALQEGVTEHEQRCPGEPSGVEHGEPEQEQPGVGDRRERQQSLEVVLEECHHGTDEGSHDADHDEQRPHVGHVQIEGGREDGPVRTRRGEEAELDHHAGEQHAHRRRRDGVGVGEPEVERDDGALDETTENMVRSAKGYGGPQPDEVRKMIEEFSVQIETDKKWLETKRQQIANAEKRLDEEFGKL